MNTSDCGAGSISISKLRFASGLLLALTAGTGILTAEAKKEFKYTAAAGASVTIINEFGNITVKPSSGRQVVISATPASSKVEVDSSQNGPRIEALTHFLQKANENEGRVDYEITVPPDVSITVRCATGPITLEGMKGDISLRGDAAPVDVRNVNNTHLHIQTVSGPITLTDVNDAHVEIVSASGKVKLNSVNGPKVTVSTTDGDIGYDGDFSGSGLYSLMNRSGNIDVALPATASVDLDARAVKGSVQNDFPLQPKTHLTHSLVEGRTLAGTSNSASSSVQLSSFSGTIRVKKR